MWLFTIRVASYGELFTSGVFRIADQEGVLFQYLCSCEGVYERYSIRSCAREHPMYHRSFGCRRQEPDEWSDAPGITLSWCPCENGSLLIFKF